MSTPGAYPGLAALLWTVREQLEAVLYRLVVVRLIVTDGSPRWLPRADAELNDTLEALHTAEVLRAAEVEAIMPGHPFSDSLAEVMGSAPEPWAGVFEEHRDALQLLLTEIDAGASETRRALQTALRRFRVPARLASRAPREDGAVTTMAALRAAMATVDNIPQLSLQEFLA